MKNGILYCLSNKVHWANKLKIGLTIQDLKKRIGSLQTSLFFDCEIECYTNNLVDCRFYESIIHFLLKKYRLRKDREFFEIEASEVKEIFKTINLINTILDTEEKLNEYIENNYPKNIKREKSSESSEVKRHRKKKKGIYIDTSSL